MQRTNIGNFPPFLFSVQQLEEILSENVPVPLFLDIGTPHRRTTWEVQNIAIVMPPVTWSLKRFTGALKVGEKQQLRLKITVLLAGAPFFVQIIPQTFISVGGNIGGGLEEEQVETQEERTYVLETYTPLLVTGGTQLALILSFEAVKPILVSPITTLKASTKKQAEVVANINQEFGSVKAAA